MRIERFWAKGYRSLADLDHRRGAQRLGDHL